MAFIEALRLLVDADVQGAVRGLEKVGATADRELGRSEQALDKWGNRLTSLGTGMMAFGAAAIVGLGALARESEQANLAQVKLQNTIDNMPKLAGATASEFTDLADSIQKVTAADADAIVEAEALLGTFNLTADQIKGITPLVVDYARKFGIDMADAAVQVGKALDGQAGALKRNGVSIDEALFATDRYAAVQKALSDQVGGFAEAEGKTFAGSLERMKNELGDLAEGVGGGAVDAFTKLFSIVGKGANALESISPGAQNVIGQVATFGAVGLVAAGGISTLIGKAIEARDNFSRLGDAASSMTDRIGGIKVAAGVAAGVAGLAGLLVTMKAVSDAAAEKNLNSFVEALNSTSDAAQTTNMSMVKLLMAWDDLGSGFDSVLGKSVPAAEQFMVLAEAAGASSDELDKMRQKIEEKKQADIGGQAAQSDYNAEVQAGADALDGATDSVQSYSDALRALFDPVFAVVNAEQQLQDANNAVTAAEMNLAKAVMEHGEGSLEAAAAADELRKAQMRATESAVGEESAMSVLRDEVRQHPEKLDEVRRKLDEFVVSGQVSAATAAAFRAELDRLDGRVVDVRIVTTRQDVFLAGSHNIPLRDSGGRAEAGNPYLIGVNRRPELFIPDQSGMIVPLSGGWGGGGGGTTVNYQLVFNGPTNDRQVIESIKRFEQSNGAGWRN